MEAFIAHKQINVIPLENNAAAWDEIVATADYCPIEYVRSIAAYHAHYLAEVGKHFINQTRVITYSGEPVAIWPLWAVTLADARQLGSDGRTTVLPPLFKASAGEGVRKKVTQWCTQEVNAFAHNQGLVHWQGTESQFSLTASDWHKKLMEQGAQPTLRHELYVPVHVPPHAVRAQFRKSYKPLISKAESLWQAEVIATPTASDITAFAALHAEVAGRITRTEDNWEVQRQSVANGDGFVVFLKDQQSVLVGAALFQHSATEAKYMVAAYRRELFDQPVGHLAQWIAMQEMQRRGIQWYKLGDRPYVQDDRNNTEKEVQIGFFKEGFGAKTRLLVHTKNSVPAIES